MLRRILRGAAIFVLTTFSSAFLYGQTTFTNATLIDIPDSGASAVYPSPIVVTGLGNVTDVNVRLNGLTHTFPDDVALLLVSPSGARMVIQSDVGGGVDIVSPLTYTFDDQAAAGIPNAGPMPANNASARPSSVGDDELFPPPAPADCQPAGECPQAAPAGTATLNGIFGGTPANGTWNLYVIDCCAGDEGSFAGGWSIIITATPVAAPGDANMDYNGDGKTDFVVARATDTPLSDGLVPVNRGATTYRERRKMDRENPAGLIPNAPAIYWYTSVNGSGATSVQPFGDAATDWVLAEDFDGDAKDDFTVWREAASPNAGFWIFQSLTSTVRFDQFGQTGDDPAVLGDYDNDNKADPAVYRCPVSPAPAGQCYFFYRGSNANPGGNVTYVPWGFGNDGDFFPLIGDFDGDGRHDFCVQRTDPNQVGQGQFVLLKSGGGIEYINWGLDTDFLIPGDYDGDAKADFCVRRLVGAQRQHYILTRTGATWQVPWGIAGDVSVPGDYDGDAKTDVAIWRPNVDPSQNFFWILNSNTQTVSQFEWGQCPAGNCDFAVAGWAVH